VPADKQLYPPVLNPFPLLPIFYQAERLRGWLLERRSLGAVGLFAKKAGQISGKDYRIFNKEIEVTFLV